MTESKQAFYTGYKVGYRVYDSDGASRDDEAIGSEDYKAYYNLARSNTPDRLGVEWREGFAEGYNHAQAETIRGLLERLPESQWPE